MNVPAPIALRQRRAGIALLAVAWIAPALGPRPVNADWVDSSQFDNFTVRSEFRLNGQKEQSLLRQIATLRADLQSQLQLTPGDDLVEVSLFSHRWSYVRHISVRVPEGASRTALYVKAPDRGRVYVYRRFGFETDLRHECTHAILHTMLPFVPMWLDEGLAEYFEVRAADRVRSNPHLAEVKRALWFGWDPALTELERLDEVAQMGSSEYRDCWAWAHFLLHGPQEVRQEFAAYLQDIHVGTPTDPLSARLAARNINARALLVHHFRNWK